MYTQFVAHKVFSRKYLDSCPSQGMAKAEEVEEGIVDYPLKGGEEVRVEYCLCHVLVGVIKVRALIGQ
jgi:hypothetical protein